MPLEYLRVRLSAPDSCSQHKLERLEEVERAFVHIDYQIRDVDDHDPYTSVARKTVEATAARLRAARERRASEEGEDLALCHSVEMTSTSSGGGAV